MKKFVMLKQNNEKKGCIPTCVASVLNYLNVKGTWDEDRLLKMYDNPCINKNISGFSILKKYLESISIENLKVNIIDKNELYNQDIFYDFIKQKIELLQPILLPIRTNNGTHCLVISKLVHEYFEVFDPCNARVRLVNLSNAWTGELLWFSYKYKICKYLIEENSELTLKDFEGYPLVYNNTLKIDIRNDIIIMTNKWFMYKDNFFKTHDEYIEFMKSIKSWDKTKYILISDPMGRKKILTCNDFQRINKEEEDVILTKMNMDIAC